MTESMLGGKVCVDAQITARMRGRRHNNNELDVTVKGNQLDMESHCH